MKKVLSLILLVGLLALISCDPNDPSQPNLNIPKQILLLNKMVAVGNSLTAGFQSAGLAQSFQEHSYPYQIAMQIKKLGIKVDFQQPLIENPGIGSTPGRTPLMLKNGALVTDPLPKQPQDMLLNALLPRPYDNLGVPGADANDVLNTVDGSGGNPFFDIVLRNPNFANTTQLQQAILLNPTLVILWIGNNDALGAALAGGDLTQLTSQSDFQSRMTAILTELRTKTHAGIVMGNIPFVTDIPFVNTLDIIYHDSPALGISAAIPVVFDQTLQPVQFSAGLYIPLLTEETNVTHLTLPALTMYQQGIGVPDSAALVQLGIPGVTAGILQAGMIQAGLNPTGQPLPGSVTITADEESAIRDAVNGFNATITALAGQFQVPVVDANTALGTLNTTGISGYSGRFVLLDPVNTGFSLDGIHPNNGGYGIVANLFIQTINQAFSLQIPQVDVSTLKGQYTGVRANTRVTEAINKAKDIFIHRK